MSSIIQKWVGGLRVVVHCLCNWSACFGPVASNVMHACVYVFVHTCVCFCFCLNVFMLVHVFVYVCVCVFTDYCLPGTMH